LFLFCFSASCATTATRPDVHLEQNKALVRKLFQAIQDGDLATFNSISNPKGLVHTFSGTKEMGGPHSDLKAACPMCVSVNPRHVTIDFMLAEDDLVTVRSTTRGTHSGTLIGIPATGHEISISYINVYRIRDGRIVENWVGADRLALAQQLGMKLCPKSTAE
jgi:ketosteroid isomerase-like protein